MLKGFSPKAFKNFALVTLANFLFFCNFSSFFLLPLYIKDLGGTEADIGFIMGTFGITSLGAIPFVAFLVDKYGRRRFLIIGYALMFVTSLSYLFVSDLSPLVYALRLLQGISFAFSFTAAGTFVADYIPPQRRAEGLGIFSAFTIASYAIGPSLGEFLIDLEGFKLFFLSASFFSLVSLVLSLFAKDGTFARSGDRFGLGFFKLIVSRKYLAVLSANVILAGGLGAVLNFVAAYFTSKSLNAYYFFLTYTITVVAVRVIGGRVSDSLGRMTIALPSMIVMSFALAAMALVDSPLTAVGVSFLFSFGYGFLYPTLSALVIDNAQADERGKAMGAFNASYSMGINFLAFPLGVAARDFGYEGMYLSAAALVFVGFLLLVITRPGRHS
ncbi:MAG: MFS transporter [Thermodesulfobacteriota bacterium]